MKSMDELIERFLKYIYRKNTQSEKTIESYRNDLNQFKEYLLSQSIDSFVLIGVSLLIYGVAKKGDTMTRKKGIFMILVYVIYMIYIIVR